MKRVEIVFEESLENRIEVLLSTLAIEHYTRFDGLTGVGDSGRRLNTAVGPGTNSLVFVVVEDDKVDKLQRALNMMKAASPSLGIQAFISPVERML